MIQSNITRKVESLNLAKSVENDYFHDQIHIPQSEAEKLKEEEEKKAAEEEQKKKEEEEKLKA